MPVNFAKFPPTAADRKRIQRYEYYRKLYKGDHADAFADKSAKKPEGLDEIVYLVANYPKVICLAGANLQVGNPPVISYEDPTLNAALKEIIEHSDLECALFEAVVSAAYRGDTCLRAVRDAAGQVHIEPVPAYGLFVEPNPHNVRKPLAMAIAWEVEDKKHRYLRVEQREGSRIWQELYLLNQAGRGHADCIRVTDQALLSQFIDVSDEVDTGLPIPTLVHIPNQRTDEDFWGESDFEGGLDSLFDEVNNRLTQIARILDEHADPKMVGLAMDTDPNGNLLIKQNRFFEAEDPDIGKDLPRLLTWDAQLASAFRQLEEALNTIYRISETSPLMVGYVQGARFDSGRAFRMQFVPSLAKTSRKRLYLNAALRRIVRAAMMLKLGRNDIPAPNIKWRDGLPKDMTESAQVESTRKTAGLTSALSAIRRLDDADEETARAELREIQAEQSTASPMTEPTPQQPGTNPEEDPRERQLNPAGGESGNDPPQ